MSLNNMSTDLLVITVNGRQMTDWGETASPVKDEPIDPKSAIRRGQGGNAVRLNRINPGRRVTLALNPGSPDSAYMQGLFNSTANITFSATQIGTLENAIGTEGAIVNDASKDRGGMTVSDDVYIMEFNGWTGLKGGN